MIHKYKLNGYNIVLDVNSGGVHVVDDLTYDVLDNVAPPFEDKCPQKVIDKLGKIYPEEDIAECYKEIKELYDEKILYSPDEYEQYSNIPAQGPIKSMCLNVAHDCNLRCTYCFAEQGDFGGKRELMPLETGKKALDFLMEKSKGRQYLEVDFFGGEPLMNFNVVKELVKYGRELEKKFDKHIRFTITTNGMLLNEEKIDFINKEMANCVLSIDGRKEVNDRFRLLTDGKRGCYDIIVPKYKELVAKRGDKEYYVRGTFTKENQDFSEDVFSLVNEGFDQISVEPVVGDSSDPYALTEAELPNVFREYDRLCNRILDYESKGKHFNFFHFMIDLDQGPCAIKRMKGCGCGNEYVCVTPSGDIYPCHQFVGKDEFIMGNVNDGTFNTEIKKEFVKANIYTKPDCRECWARFFCSGGCDANNYEHMGDIKKSYRIACELEKKRVECAIMLHVARMDRRGEL